MVNIFTETTKLNREGCTAMRPRHGGPVSFWGKILQNRIGRDLRPVKRNVNELLRTLAVHRNQYMGCTAKFNKKK